MLQYREVIAAAYARSDLFERRRLLMNDWEVYKVAKLEFRSREELQRLKAETRP